MGVNTTLPILPLDGDGGAQGQSGRLSDATTPRRAGRGESAQCFQDSLEVTHSTIAAQWSPSPIKGEDVAPRLGTCTFGTCPEKTGSAIKQ